MAEDTSSPLMVRAFSRMVEDPAGRGRTKGPASEGSHREEPGGNRPQDKDLTENKGGTPLREQE